MHARVFALAVKYQISGLRDIVRTKFTEVMKTAVTEQDIAGALAVTFLATPDEERDLRDSTIETLLGHEIGYLKFPAVEAAIKAIPGLCYDLLKTRQSSESSVDAALKSVVCFHCKRKSLFRCGACGAVTSKCACFGSLDTNGICPYPDCGKKTLVAVE